MLTENQIQRLGKLVAIAPYLDKEWQAKLAELIRDLKAAEGAGCMPQSAIQPMVDAVGDKLMAQIANEDRSAGRSEPGWFTPKKPDLERLNRPEEPKDERPEHMRPVESGWAKPMSDQRSKAQTEIFDQMVESLVGSVNDTSKLR